jgi:catechol 2,3-dioxygenase-like lactoylglutathione lyase family enzyme
MSEDGGLGLILWTTDIAGLAQFLESVAGLTVEALHPGYASLRIDGSQVVLHDDEAYRGHPWYDALRREGVARGIGAELRFRVADVEASYGAALRKGGLAIQAPYDQDGVRECQVMGPDGYVLSLWQPIDAGSSSPLAN